MKKIFILLITLSTLIGCDRITKIKAVENLKDTDPITYLGGLFQLTYYENSGAMLSLGANLSEEIRFYIFTLSVGLVLLFGLIYIVIKPLSKINFILALLIIGGGLGNLYDRAFNNGQVIDFMLITIGPIRTGVFNVADIAITIGGILLVLLSTKWGEQLTSKLTQTRNP